MKRQPMRHLPLIRKAQSGIVLVEVMASILIFTFAVIGLIGVQASAVSELTASKNRANASYLADQIIGQMWTDQGNLANYKHNGGAAPVAATPCTPAVAASTNTNVLAWLAQVNAGLPGATTTHQQIYIGAGNTVIVTICWKMPTESAFHNFSETAQIL